MSSTAEYLKVLVKKESVELEKEKVKVIWLQVQEKKQSPRKKNDVLVELSEKHMVCERIEKK